MAINIYIGKENLPKDKRFIFDVEKIIFNINICGTDFQRRVLEEVELGSYYNNKYFKDRFGGLLYYSMMSTGSKILFSLEAFPDLVINGDELGDMATSLIMCLDSCNIFFTSSERALPCSEGKSEVTCNGVKYSSIGKFLEGVHT